MVYDVIIIGLGAAGVSASIYAKRSGLNVAVVNLVDAIKEVLISLKFIEDKEVISNEQTVIG